jgi:D-alanyl-D-alanine endopeptidase (penicillin-binding protein 7)
MQIRNLFVLVILACSFSVCAEDTEPTIQTPQFKFDVDQPKLVTIVPDLNIASEAAFAINLDTQEIIFSKNETEVRSIASITKMMTSYVVVQQPQIDLQEVITISQDDINLAKRAHRASKLRPGMHFTRERLLNLALMASENVAAAALGRTTFEGGLPVFIGEMNKMAVSLGMLNTTFVDPIGIGIDNQSTASDLVRLLAAASGEELIRDFSTTKFKPVQLPIKNSKHPTEYKNTDALVGFKDWDILVQKTGYTNPAGHCVAMIVDVQGEKYAIIVLASPNNQQRALDAIKIRQWLLEGKVLSSEEADAYSPYHRFVLYKHGKPIPNAPLHRRHHRHYKA